ncbi:cytidylate kinase [Catellatospora methionotrophica]|uniref:Cytidylate kinase n=1 Tax=Catellatospora methionotrophica TaxID=121620 RepID=A0A8J3LD55_9ACTN|nr:(d)CMP kinase [Catellatospora methionotrophica]GIG18833.1 cytidylate kinase [Catellatospora methionotrophica]
MAELRCVVAVDGPSGSGKSTVSRRLARRLDARYLDTGAMYRALTWAVLQAGVDLTDPDGIAKVAVDCELLIMTDPEHPSISVNGENVDAPIRGGEVTAAVSAVSAVPFVRQVLTARQRAIIEESDRIVVEGRDIGTVVAPDADLKVFLTASSAERARRRSAETAGDHAATEADLARRDHLDSTRKVNPLQQAADAVVLDSTELGIDEVVSELYRLLTTRKAA